MLAVLLLEFYFNPRPPCGGRPGDIAFGLISPYISIHVPRVEDDAFVSLPLSFRSISIHVPRVEDDWEKQQSDMGNDGFQSTSPVWRTTAVCEKN